MLALAYVAGDDFNVTQALETLKARLKGKHPTVAFAVPKIPRNEMGKVMRHKLRDAAHGTKPDATIW
jgi:acyl-coenzyme A synthetase/AMP-(fatty) acid ligase